MDPWRTTLVLLAASSLVPGGFAQSDATTAPQTNPDDRSVYFNRSVVHPEALSGVWETSNGEGGAVGIHLVLGTKVPADDDPPVWTPQLWQYLEVGVFERKGPELKFGEENYFTDSVRGGGALLENDWLELHFASPWKNTPSVDLDLLRRADGCWHGRFHRDNYDSVVNLCRPTAGPGVPQNALVGTWSSGIDAQCIHIFATGSGTFIGWSDALEVSGTIIFGRNIPKPHVLYQIYGNLVKVGLAGDRYVSVEFAAYSPICCSHLFTGRLSADGAELKGDSPPGSNQKPYATTFIKMPGDSCMDPAALHRPRGCDN